LEAEPKGKVETDLEVHGEGENENDGQEFQHKHKNDGDESDFKFPSFMGDLFTPPLPSFHSTPMPTAVFPGTSAIKRRARFIVMCWMALGA
jgi:hypothetical protein